MDGLMIDSEPLQSKAYETVLKEYGKDTIFGQEGTVQKIGVRERDNWELIKKTHGLSEDTDKLIDKRQYVYLELIRQHAIARAGLIELLDLLKQHNIKMALASSSILSHIHLVLAKLDVANYFNAIVSGHDVPRGKPAPDIFLEAAKQLHVDPIDCVVFEDAQTGIEAGKVAGAKVVAVPNKYTKNHDFSKADLVIDSLENINWNTIKTL
ncbi:MAG: HAD-superfamily hydrolase, subfamily IA, variant 3 [Microgenomates group bacterium GW2011_GWC1_44_37]|uniref:HAD-superfamily hydrolase, subfamily IA, variant 3 n=1 Tax=Candidatus Collierbacteria bacterium GW2011_GWB2_44_22 TaxID=1618387 RepID=A0A0G1KTX5_9BACT|nr:MAG: HAD-superfamily hydrolase, subfamily IA, variant 3 [Candidatus Collierbacteria bacterium GW2011_GWA2_44_13]KKT51354.1 MAG: HAD-superfamily hydrolase, subfamily IA, variant 3 [Candidatus Collierbacteria bacterium GW2011_GWB2_44_22]KKT61468.1 MAG: HAD-superfamily hydrolase, subfamily IA, variant 3 [Candidatus Collierbacteria bacterium GW2011_GWD1_44_27]KKT65625.1 MAG: HAD-superfamily hydrolase, subfamily IA, variant 3 [Candidatus Collierbacteria bacterium GW2011_GWC2_44_30]KKT68556.1 MAG: